MTLGNPDEQANRRLSEEMERVEEQLERSRTHDDPSVEAELIDPKVRRRYAESGAFK